ncbi:putative beta-galactosidase [Corynespora cassiicola Philippines]|uniref:Beta-glucuronidase n=1 Tax=Corynespora cassiicola Philippines TaxID=1448308 RepID=A0A2T2NNT2_CORCC|nr:putative beta-galactosidase [Corynespora cassiicola Philippines]
MLRPQSTESRELVSLDGLWNFQVIKATPQDDADKEWTAQIPYTTQMPVPASYNDILLDTELRNHVGWVKYQRHVHIPQGWNTKRIFIRCDAATHRGKVYANDQLLIDHQGGYAPFDTELTGLISAGTDIKLTIAVSNELSNETIPPGKIESFSDGTKKQTYLHDFFNYSGLARSVWLYSLPEEYIRDATVTTNVDWENDIGLITYKVETNTPISSSGANIRVSVHEESGKSVGESRGSSGEIHVPSPRLWQPGAAYLYQVIIELLSSEQDSTVQDTYDIFTGIRTIEVRDARFLINNKPFYFTGFGKHEDTPIRGKGHDPAYMVHDFELMKWLGANSFRTSHYPYAEEVLDYADRQGIVVINETPAVGLNLGIASGLFGNKAPPTFSPEFANDATQAAHRDCIRSLISRDKNHASVVMWSIANEPASHEEGALEYFTPLVELARSLDTRPLCFANFGLATSAKDLITPLFDVLALNRYYGWYEHCGDLSRAGRDLKTDLESWREKYPSKPIIMTEYGADTVAGLHSAGVTPWSEEFQASILEVYHGVFDEVDGVIGEQVWSFSDFQTSQAIFRVDGNKKGIFTRDRRPKNAAQVLRRRWLLEGKGKHVF